MTDPFAALRQKFLTRCEDDLHALRGLAAANDLGSPELRRLTHRLAGAAGTFGHPAISEAAARIDGAFADGQTVQRSDLDGLIQLMAAALAD